MTGTWTQFAALADGRVWTAPEALDLGLIDGIATMAETLSELQAEAAERARARAFGN